MVQGLQLGQVPRFHPSTSAPKQWGADRGLRSLLGPMNMEKDMGFENMIYIYMIYIYMIYYIYIRYTMIVFQMPRQTEFLLNMGLENRTDIKLQKLLKMTNI